VCFLVPQNDWLSQILAGVPNYMQFAGAWDDVGACTPDQVAAVMETSLRNVRINPVTVGMIAAFAADNMQYVNQNPADGPSQWLKCEGQDLSVVAYEALYSIVGNTWGGDGTHFFLPDLRGRVLVDAGSGGSLTPYALGTTFGEERHTLNSGEMPSHTHTTGNSLLLGTSVPPPLDALGPNPLPAFTGSAGGDGSHENRQPSAALFFYIQAFP
jgi:microcystin-dependent protein